MQLAGWKSVRLLILILVGLHSLFSAYASDWPEAQFAPNLIHTSQDSSLCTDYTNSVRSTFFEGHPKAPDYDTRFLAAQTHQHVLSDELFENRFERQRPYSRTGLYVGDIDNDGAKDRIFKQTYFSSASEGHRSFLTLTKLSDSEIGLIRANWRQMFEEEHPGRTVTNRRLQSYIHRNKAKTYQAVKAYGVSVGRKDVSSFFKATPRAIPQDGDIQKIALAAFQLTVPFQLVEYDGRLFGDATVAQRWVSRPRDHLSTKSFKVLLSFDQDMRPRSECIVEAMPSRESLPPLVLGDLNAEGLLDRVVKVEGTEGRCAGGSLRPWASHKRQREYMFRDIQIQPWKLERYARPLRQLNWLRAWRLDSLSNMDNYQLLAESLANAEEGLSAYYRTIFDVPSNTAGEWATKAKNIVASSATLGSTSDYSKLAIELDRIEQGVATPLDFLKVSEFAREVVRLRADQKQQLQLDRAFRYAVAAEAKAATLNELILMGARIDSGNESALMLALRRKEDVKVLLDKGADPNRSSVYGKTPLMLAAQVNAVSTVKLLLEAGADPNKTTLPPNEFLPSTSAQYQSSNLCDYNIHFGNRTALMYAAENASPSLVKILLDAGANIQAVDSSERDVFDYLSRNQQVSEEERLLIDSMLERAMVGSDTKPKVD